MATIVWLYPFLRGAHMNKLLLLLLAALLAGCAGTIVRNDYDPERVKIGTPESELRGIMGEPYRMTTTKSGNKIWVWTYTAGFSGAKSFSATIKDGKVVSVFPAPKKISAPAK
jgi:hypothetical protein